MSSASTEDGSLGYKAFAAKGLIVRPRITGNKISNLERDLFREEIIEAIEDTKDLRKQPNDPILS